MKLIKLSLIVSLLLGLSDAYAQVKQAKEVFTRWLDEDSAYFQHCIVDCALATQGTGDSHFNKLKSMLPIRKQLMQLVGTADGSLDEHKVHVLRQQAATSIPKFLQSLEQAEFATQKVNTRDERDTFKVVLKRYTNLFKTVFADQSNKSMEREFAAANRFVEFCFGTKSFPQAKKILSENNSKPIGRLLYAGMWKTLAGNGWKYWHKDTLKRLATSYKNGKTAVYIAGGSDVYQLLAHGIYNIRVIDPQLTGAQDNYYADQWQWLLKGEGSDVGQGDELHINAQGKNIVAKRVQVMEGEQFSITLDEGKELLSPSGTVVWDVFENDMHKGKLTFERRLAGQDDFVPKKNEELLMSFNELFFIASPEDQGGWPIDPHKLSKGVKIHVKQLRKPMTKAMIENMAWVEENHLAFLRLGTAVK